MTKEKYIIMIILTSILLLVPNISNAASRQTYKDDAQNIEWSYDLDDNENVINLICETANITGKVTIPEKIDGKTVISVGRSKTDYTGPSVFTNCVGITEVIMPDTITEIGDSSFSNCTGMKSITLSKKLTSIGSYAFSGCSGLQSITIPDSVISIGSGAFMSCSGLQSVTIPDSVISIENGAFSRCTGMKEIILPKNLTTIYKDTFSNCSSLTSVKIPDNVTTIEGDFYSGAFYNCKNLQKILIPDNVSSIEEHTFQDCPKLTIYGNDGMVSKEFAEENEIPFDYIANWDKASSGSDVTAPTVTDILVTSKSVLGYEDTNKKMFIVPTGNKLVINVNFSENVDGKTAPTLTIKFGDGQNIQLTDGVIGGSSITYTYTIKDTDKGIMATVDYKGGDIKDVAGNDATLSCPALKVESYDNVSVYANGTKTDTNNGNSNNGGTTNGGTNNGSSNNSGTKNDSNKGQTDKTVSTDKLPQTGVGTALITSLIVILGVSIFAYLKNRKYKGI